MLRVEVKELMNQCRLFRSSTLYPLSSILYLLSSTLFRVRHSEEAVPPVYAREDLLAARFRLAKVLPFQQSAPFISNLSLAIFSGLLLVFAFPDWNLWSLGWVGTAPLIMAIVRERKFWRSLLLGSVTGTVFYAGSSYWVTYSMHNYGGISLWLCYIILIVFSATLGVFTGMFAALLGLAIKRFGGWLILAAPIVWAASEWLRLQMTGMGWNPLGYSQAFQPAVIQVARFGGVYLVSAIMVAPSTALVFALVYLERRRGIVVLTAAGLIAIATVLYGESLRPAIDESGSVSVAVIQPNIPVDGAWDDPKFAEQMFLRHVSLCEQAIQANARDAAPNDKSSSSSDKTTSIDLVIWPESSMNFEYDRDSALRQTLAEFTLRNRVYLLMNTWGFAENAGASEPPYNSSVLISPAGAKIAEYDKNALVPFGEYIPGRSWIPFTGHVKALVGDISPGRSITLGEAVGAKLGMLICFETTRPDLARRMRSDGASALVQLSNEAWFGPTSAPRQMLTSAIFRAVENNVEVIRAANSGVSARIDRYGIVHGETPMFETATRTWKIKTENEARGDSSTFYTRHGDVFAVSCTSVSLLLLLGAALYGVWKRKEETKKFGRPKRDPRN
ncbi:MAG TPA: apolipoprotein N-acyltransferase [Blastocatellia bacterium]|nr:apolipoprotein N-acyltransferase [Blastocatellia bacterium]